MPAAPRGQGSAPRGQGKRLVCFCVFGENPLYTEGVIANALLVPSVYPSGWHSRVYCGDDVPTEVIDRLKSLPSTEVSIFSREEWPGRSAQLLRFIPAGLPTVDVAIVRDADSRVNPREAEAVQEWLATPGARYHVMHEAMHDDRYGSIMGGMWGARRLAEEVGSSADDGAPCPGLGEAVETYLRPNGEAESMDASRMTYGDDMAFLERFLAPQISASNCVHHVDGDHRRRLGDLTVPRRPFPETPYRGFVGQPVTCSCAYSPEGCAHVSGRVVPRSVASRVCHDPDIMETLQNLLLGTPP